MSTCTFRRATRAAVLSALLLTLVAATAPADEKPAPATITKYVVGKYVSETGRMLRRSAPGKPWQVVNQNDKLYAGDLLVAGVGAAFTNGTAKSRETVRVSFQGDLHGQSPLPIIESAVVLNRRGTADLDFILDRGRVDVTNLKKEGEAKVRVTVQGKLAEFTLHEPGTRFAMEMYGRWPRNAPFVKDPRPGYGPILEIVLLVLEGSIDVKHGSTLQHLKAPPGPALIQIDPAHGLDATPQRLEKLPAWASADKLPDTDQSKARRAAFDHFRKAVAAKGIDAAVDELAESDQPADRRLAVYVMGALDDLEGLRDILGKAKHPDLWENGVLALRHWIGRSPGQDQLLYKGLLGKGGYSPAHAETVLQLLHGLSDDKLAHPETYELLIEYLSHDKLAIRGLAHWHLVRLVPAGRKIDYQPLASPELRTTAQKAWRKLIPPGQMPPRPDAKKPAAKTERQPEE